MKPNYEKLIWEACGSPMRIIEEAEKSGGYFRDYEAPIEITLAHVMQFLYKTGNYYKLNVYGDCYILGGIGIKFSWIFLTKNKEAALFSDQRKTTQKAIIKIIKDLKN